MSDKAKEQNASTAVFFNGNDRKKLNEICALTKEIKTEMSELKRELNNNRN